MLWSPLLLAVALAGPVESLPGPVVSPVAFALLANSRQSVYSGFQPDLPVQVLANVLWAMDRAPRLGADRDLYVATPENLYRYRPGAGLELHRPGDRRYNSGSAFEVGVAADVPADAGLAVQSGLLAATALRAEHGAAACPMSWATDHANEAWEADRPVLMTVVFGRAEARPLDSSWLQPPRPRDALPDPVTAGPDSFEITLLGLNQDTSFATWSLSLETVSQLLWAAAGPTPHRTIAGEPGLTIPAGLAAWPGTAEIALARAEGVDRYRNRAGPVPDHRLERIVPADRREELLVAAPGLTIAPVLFVISVPDTADGLAEQEAGAAAFGLLAQARALGLACRLAGPLDRRQSRTAARALGLVRGLAPALVVAVGEPVNQDTQSGPGTVEIVRATSFTRRGEPARVEYLLRVPGDVRVDVFDLLGRPVRQLPAARRSAGYHGVEWDGLDDAGTRVKPGSYLIGVFGPGAVAQHRVTVL
ncbi:MAG: FlgD immunoglobulin-like domain containing protein [bacterium]